MARRPRIGYPGAAYHVMARGNQGQAIFADDTDRKLWLQNSNQELRHRLETLRRWRLAETQHHERRCEAEISEFRDRPLSEELLRSKELGILVLNNSIRFDT